MKKHEWVTVAESFPPSHTVVIACLTFERDRIFAGWVQDGAWWSVDPTVGPTNQSEKCGFCGQNLRPEPTVGPTIIRVADIRAIDLWLTLPEWPAGSGCTRVMAYPA